MILLAFDGQRLSIREIFADLTQRHTEGSRLEDGA